MLKRHTTCYWLGLLACCLPLWQCNQPQAEDKNSAGFTATTSQNVDLNTMLVAKQAIAFYDPLKPARPLDIQRLIINPKNGNFLVLEQNSTRGILEFDAHAKFIRAFSKRGEGEQEYLAPIDMAFDPASQQLFLLSSFKIFQFDLKQNQVAYFTIEQLFPHLSKLASFCAIDLSANHLFLILEDISSKGHVTRYYYQLGFPIDANSSKSEFAIAKQIPQQSDQIGKSAIVVATRNIYTIEPPQHHLILHQGAAAPTQYKNPSIELLNSANSTHTSFPIKVYHKQDDDLWFHFQKPSDISTRYRLYFVSGVLNTRTRQVKLFQPPSGKEMTTNTIALLHSKSHILTIHQDQSYGLVNKNTFWQRIQEIKPDLPFMGDRERPADLIVFEKSEGSQQKN